MKKLILLIILTICAPLYAAEVKFTEFPADATPTGDDLLATVDDPAGTPTSKKATIANVVGAANALSATTAAALTSNPTDCTQSASVLQYAYAIAANGNLTCATLVTIQALAPTPDDDTGDGYIRGTKWIVDDGSEIYEAVDVTAAAAVWRKVYPAVETQTLDTVADLDPKTTGRSSFANSLRVEGTTANTGVAIYQSDTTGGNVVCYVAGVEGDCDRVFTHIAGRRTVFKDPAGNEEVIYVPDVGFSKLTIATEAQGNILYRNATQWTVLAPGTSGQVLQTNGAAANPSWADAAAGGASAAVPMRMMTIEVGAANAFVDTIDGTNFDYSGVRYVDAVTGKSNWTANLASVPTNLILKHKAISGAGGNVSLGIYCRATANNEAFDSTVAFVHGASGNPAEVAVNTSANLTRTAISLSALTMAAGDEITCGIDRVGGDALDTLGVDWLLIGASLE